MSTYLKNSKKKKINDVPEANPEKIEESVSVAGQEALTDGDVEAAVEAGVNPMAIPDFFNNIRNNYYVGNRIIWLTGEIDWPIVTEVIKRLNFYEDGSKEPIFIYISSPGGLCDAGFALIDVIEKLKKRHIDVYTICAGSCSSMASVILASGTKGCRYAFPSSRIMIHQAAGGLFGKLDEMANEVKEIQYWTDLIVKQLSKTCGKSAKEIEKSMAFDHYMCAKESKKFGIVDNVDVLLS